MRVWKKGTLGWRPSWLPVPSPLQALPLPPTPLAAAGFLIRRTTAGLQIPRQQDITLRGVLVCGFSTPLEGTA